MFQYAIDMDVSRPIPIAADTVALACMFRHFNRAPIAFGGPASGADAALSLGYRLFNGRSKELLHEGRLSPKGPVAKPEQWLPFELKLPSDLVCEEDEFEIVVDLVMNGDDWLHERGHNGGRFALSFTDSRERPAPAREAQPVPLPPAPAAQAPSLAEQLGPGLLEMLRLFDFSDYGAVCRLQRMEGRPPRARSLPGDLLARFNAPVPLPHDRRFPLTALMEYFMRVRGEKVDRLIGKRSGRFELMRRFFDVSHQLAGSPGDYFPPELVSELNEFVLADGLFELPLSRLMLWHWLSENRLIAADMSHDRDNIFWWWVTGAMPANNVPDVFIPSAIVSHLGGVHETFRNRTVEISRFALRAYAESEQMRLRYDLKTASGLIAYAFDFVIHNASNRINRHFIGAAARDYWTRRVTLGGVAFTRFEIALVNALPEHRPILADGARPGDAAAARRFLDEIVPVAAPDWIALCLAPTEARKPAASAPLPPGRAIRLPAEPRARGGNGDARSAAALAAAAAQVEPVLVAGLVGSPSGLGVNLKMSCQTFEAIGAPFSVYDVQRRRLIPGAGAAEAGSALFHVNADMVGEALASDLSGELARRKRIGFFLWELDVLPRSHVFGAGLVDEIWAPSQFVAEVYAQATSATVKLVKKFITMPDIGPAQPRPAGPFRFLTSFDFHSGVERKNPYAVVRAFREAFPLADRDVELTVKTTEYVHGHWGDANNQWQLINEAAALDARIRIVVDALPEREFFAMIRDHDCVVSSHRAEGFGYLPAYALVYRKPVIVTDYSGTADFCTPQTAYPVGCKLTPVRAHEFISEVPGARWAEIDHGHLVETMRQVRGDPAEAQARAGRGARLIQEEYSLAAQAARYREAMDWPPA